MHCPQCGVKDWKPPCPDCGFAGDPGMVEVLSNLNFLLAQLETWDDVPTHIRNSLRQKYSAWRRQAEVVLGLREAPLDAQAALAARLELLQLRGLLDVLSNWTYQRGWLTPAVAQELQTRTGHQIDALRERLRDAPRTETIFGSRRVLLQTRFFAEIIEELHNAGRLADDSVYPKASAELAAKIQDLEIQTGLRERPVPAPVEPIAPPAARPKPPTPPRPPRQPLTWDRVWETLLSERTLHAILFLGVFLLFAAAVSLVVWNWETFPPWLQVAFLALFTAVFYALGWYVRVRMDLRGSGIALSAVASLLVPLDFYAFYLSGGLAQERWSQVWLLTSLICLLVYLLTAYLIQAEFFGYLVGAASGSLLAAAMQVGALDTDWWQSGLMALALLLACLAEMLNARRNCWRVLVTPLWHIALLSAAVIIPLALGWTFTARAGGRAFALALALDCWLGGLVFVLAARRYRARMIALAAAGCFPLAVFATQRALFNPSGIEIAWYALGWALLAPVYLVVGRVLSADPVRRAYSRTVLGVGVLMMGVAALWPLINLPVAAWVHLSLAASVALAARLWARPRLLYLTSLLTWSGLTTWVVSGGLTVAHLGLVWALLAILQIIAAVRLSGAAVRYDAPLYLSAWFVAGLALLPPALTSNRPILTYTLGNWMALSAWLASLSHGSAKPGLRALFESGRLRPTLFHWAAALPLPFWLWLAWGATWTAIEPYHLRFGDFYLEIRLSLVYVLAAWVLLAVGVHLRRYRWPYGLPWHTAGHLNAVAAIVALAGHQGWAALVLLAVAGFYFASACWLYARWWLALGGLALAVGWALGLDWLGLAAEPLGLALACLVLACSAVTLHFGRRRTAQRDFFPLDLAAYIIAAFVFTWQASLVAQPGASDAALAWGASAQLTLALAFVLQAWRYESELYGHIAAWLGVVAGGMAARAYSQGRGSSAAKSALLALAFVLAERGLYRLCMAQWGSLARRRFIRRAWRLYRRPLLVAGWSVSLGAIGLALVRNLFLLSEPVRKTWSVVGLFLVIGLYIWGAWLFRRRSRLSLRLVWLASALLVAPWTLLAHLGWYVWPAPPAPRYALSWLLLALLQLGVGAALVWRLGITGWRFCRPPLTVAHLIVPCALLWGVADVDTSSLTFGLAILFYLLTEALARWCGPAGVRARFVYPLAALLPVWALYLLAYYAPDAPQTSYGLLLLGLALPMLFLGRWFQAREPSYRWPFYLTAYSVAILGTMLVAHERPALIGALLFDTLLALLSAWSFREPWWLYPATATAPGALLLTCVEWRVPAARQGWALIALGGLYLLLGRLLSQRRTPQDQAWATPLWAAAFALIALGLLPSSQNRIGALLGYALAAALYVLASVWLRQPLLMGAAVSLACVPYWLALLELGVEPSNYGLALWPGIGAALLMALCLDRRWGILSGPSLASFPWADVSRWFEAGVERLTRWWALPCYAAAVGSAALSALLSFGESGRLAVCLILAAAVYGAAALRFRLRVWLLLALLAAQLSALATIHWAGWWEWAVLAFAPVTWATAVAGLAVERRLGETSPMFQPRADGRLLLQVQGWSRPLYAVLVGDFIVSQAVALRLSEQSAWVSLSHTLLLAFLAIVWLDAALAYAPPFLGLVALAQLLTWYEVGLLAWPVVMALVALAFGLFGCALRYWRRQGERWPAQVLLWERPFWFGAWFPSFFSIILAFMVGADVRSFVSRAILEWPVVQWVDAPQVQMAVSVMAILGVLYLTLALTERWMWLAYGALGLLLGAWSLELLLVWDLREVQWYAIPTGAYLLLVGYFEWTRGNKSLARWIDRTALLLLLASVFVQSLGDNGAFYALLMGVEGLALVWWGSARRLRRFLYAGVAGVMLDVIGQMLEPLFSANVIVLALAGASLIGLAILVERRLETVKALSRDLRGRLEAWE